MNKAQYNQIQMYSNVGNPNPNPNPTTPKGVKENTLTSVKEKAGQKVFCPPASEEVREFMSQYVAQKKTEGVFYHLERAWHEDFIDFYASKNWMVGSNKMKDWRAAARRWVRTQNERNVPTSVGTQRMSNVERQLYEITHFEGEKDPDVYRRELERNWK